MAVGEALVYPPLNVAYCAAVLLEAGHTVEVLDAGAENLDESQTVTRLAALQPHLLVINTSSATIALDMRIGSKAAETIGIPAVLLGSQVTHTPEYVLKNSGIDYAVRGEPEYTLRALVAALEAGEDLKTIQGVSTWQDGLPCHNPPAPSIEDLDALPFPARHLLPVDLYCMPDMDKPFTTILSSRGCPLNCSYCGYTLSQGLKWRGRSATNVVDEISQVRETFGVKSLVFRDPLFSFKMDRVAEICRLLETRKINVKWQCETAIRYLDRDLLLQMGRAGCVSVSLGVESIDPEIQKKYSKGKLRSIEHAREITRACREAGIRTRIFFMLGFPEDTRETIRDTVDFARELDPDSVQFTAVTPYPGTRLHDRLKETLNFEYEDLWGYKPVGVCRNLSNEQLEYEIKRAFRRFYMRPGRLIKAALQPATLLRRIQRYLGLYK